MLINNGRKLGRDLFEKPTLPTDEDNLKEQLKILINNKIVAEINDYLKREYKVDNRYPGKKDLERALALFKEVYNIKDSYQFYIKLAEKKDELVEYGRRLEKIKGFFESQKNYFDRAVKTIELYNKNETYIVNDAMFNIIDDLKSIVISEEPYSDIYRIPALRNILDRSFTFHRLFLAYFKLFEFSIQKIIPRRDL